MTDKNAQGGRTFLENQREKHGLLFLVAPIEGGTEILYSGALLITIEHEERLPPGFIDRLVAHLMDLLTGRRSALWDEQAIFGERPFDRGDAAARARQAADRDAAVREIPDRTAADVDGLGLA